MSKESIPEPVLGMFTVFAVGAVIWDKRFVLGNFLEQLATFAFIIVLGLVVLVIAFFVLKFVLSKLWIKIKRIHHWFVFVGDSIRTLRDDLIKVNEQIDQLKANLRQYESNFHYFDNEVKKLRKWTKLNEYEEGLKKERERKEISNKAAEEVLGGRSPQFFVRGS